MDINLKLMLYQAINFVVLMIILSIIFNKFILPFMRKRAGDLKQAFDDVEAQKRSVESLKNEVTEQLKDMRKVAKSEIDKAISEGGKMRDQMLASAEKEAVTVLDRARKEIDQEKQKAITEIRKDVAGLAIMATRQLIKKQLDEDTNRSLVEDFLKDIGTETTRK